MSFQSKVLYTGDGEQYQYTIPFPFISSSHVQVYINEVLQLEPLSYVRSGSTITFNSIPELNDAIVIQRWTSPTATLVDFEDGSTLRADDLDTSYLHNFYLSQEYADNFNELINETLINIASGAGIVETETDAIIAALVNEMLNTEQAATIQQRVTDIDNNAEAILSLTDSLQTQINTLAQGVAANVYLDDNEPVPGVPPYPDPILEGSRWYDTNDNNAPYIYQSMTSTYCKLTWRVTMRQFWQNNLYRLKRPVRLLRASLYLVRKTPTAQRLSLIWTRLLLTVIRVCLLPPALVLLIALCLLTLPVLLLNRTLAQAQTQLQQRL
jgi:hypothetical protein